MSIIKIKDAANIPSEQLEDWGTPKTIGEPICQLRGLFVSEQCGWVRGRHLGMYPGEIYPGGDARRAYHFFSGTVCVSSGRGRAHRNQRR